MTSLPHSKQTCTSGKTNDNISHLVSLASWCISCSKYWKLWVTGAAIFGDFFMFLSDQDFFSIYSSPRFMHHHTYITHTHKQLRLRTWKQTATSSAPQTWAGWQSWSRTDCEQREIRGGGKGDDDDEEVRRDGEMCWSGSGLVNRVEETRKLTEKMSLNQHPLKRSTNVLWYCLSSLKEYSTALELRNSSPKNY